MFIVPVEEERLPHSVRSAMSINHERESLGYAAAKHRTPNGVASKLPLPKT